jgi:hypothetical protein
VSAGIDAIHLPATLLVELADQFQQLESGGVDVGGQFGNFIAQAFQFGQTGGIGTTAEFGNRAGVVHGSSPSKNNCNNIQYQQ